MEPTDEQLSQWFYESQNHDHLITPWERLRPSAQAWYTDSARRFLTRLGVAGSNTPTAYCDGMQIAPAAEALRE